MQIQNPVDNYIFPPEFPSKVLRDVVKGYKDAFDSALDIKELEDLYITQNGVKVVDANNNFMIRGYVDPFFDAVTARINQIFTCKGKTAEQCLQVVNDLKYVIKNLNISLQGRLLYSRTQDFYDYNTFCRRCEDSLNTTLSHMHFAYRTYVLLRDLYIRLIELTDVLKKKKYKVDLNQATTSLKNIQARELKEKDDACQRNIDKSLRDCRRDLDRQIKDAEDGVKIIYRQDIDNLLAIVNSDLESVNKDVEHYIGVKNKLLETIKLIEYKMVGLQQNVSNGESEVEREEKVDLNARKTQIVRNILQTYKLELSKAQNKVENLELEIAMVNDVLKEFVDTVQRLIKIKDQLLAIRNRQ